MNITQDHLDEFAKHFPNSCQAEEGGRIYFLLPNLELPEKCTPKVVDALLCLSERDGYKSRLFFSEKISTPIQHNWLQGAVQVVDKNWYVFSWQTPGGLTPLEMILAQFKALI